MCTYSIPSSFIFSCLICTCDWWARDGRLLLATRPQHTHTHTHLSLEKKKDGKIYKLGKGELLEKITEKPTLHLPRHYMPAEENFKKSQAWTKKTWNLSKRPHVERVPRNFPPNHSTLSASFSVRFDHFSQDFSTYLFTFNQTQSPVNVFLQGCVLLLAFSNFVRMFYLINFVI
jgi:hypothetical protein